MRAADTSLGGPREDFPKTIGDVIARARDRSAEVRRLGFEELGRQYWKPIYHYARVAWAKSNEDAKDLTQAFFLWLMEGDALDRFLPGRGSFRTFLKTLLRHFLLNKEEAVHRLKRGGGVRILNFDGELPLLKGALSGPSSDDPDKAFDRAWKDAFLAQALSRVKERSRSTDGEIKFRVFEEYYLSAGPGRPTYSAVAGRLGIRENDVLRSLADLREDVRLEIRRELSKTVSSPEELEEEWNAFFRE